MSPPPSLYLHPERERRGTRPRTNHVPSAISPSMATTLLPPPENISVNSLGKSQLTNHTQHRPRRPQHPRPSSHSPHNKSTSNKPASHTRSSTNFPSTTTLSSPHTNAPTRLALSPPCTLSNTATFSATETVISTQKPSVTVDVLNFLDDLGITMLFKPLMELWGVEWTTLFDDVGIFYLCEPLSVIRRLVRRVKVKIRSGFGKGGGSCAGRERESGRGDRSLSEWERSTVSWVESVEREMESEMGKGGAAREHKGKEKHHPSRKRSNDGERRRRRKNDREGGSENGIARVEDKDGKEVENLHGIRNARGGGSINGSVLGSERISGANRRRNERAASSVAAASFLGRGLRDEKGVEEK